VAEILVQYARSGEKGQTDQSCTSGAPLPTLVPAPPLAGRGCQRGLLVSLWRAWSGWQYRGDRPDRRWSRGTHGSATLPQAARRGNRIWRRGGGPTRQCHRRERRHHAGPSRGGRRRAPARAPPRSVASCPAIRYSPARATRPDQDPWDVLGKMLRDAGVMAALNSYSKNEGDTVWRTWIISMIEAGLDLLMKRPQPVITPCPRLCAGKLGRRRTVFRQRCETPIAALLSRARPTRCGLCTQLSGSTLSAGTPSVATPVCASIICCSVHHWRSASPQLAWTVTCAAAKKASDHAPAWIELAEPTKASPARGRHQKSHS
jgi:hypothetical protein